MTGVPTEKPEPLMVMVVFVSLTTWFGTTDVIPAAYAGMRGINDTRMAVNKDIGMNR
jgi:hypothetical protein